MGGCGQQHDERKSPTSEANNGVDVLMLERESTADSRGLGSLVGVCFVITTEISRVVPPAHG